MSDSIRRLVRHRAEARAIERPEDGHSFGWGRRVMAGQESTQAIQSRRRGRARDRDLGAFPGNCVGPPRAVMCMVSSTGAKPPSAICRRREGDGGVGGSMRQAIPRPGSGPVCRRAAMETEGVSIQRR
jgi:hypothetical protein